MIAPIFKALWMVMWGLHTYVILAVLDTAPHPWLAVAVYLGLSVFTIPVLCHDGRSQ